MVTVLALVLIGTALLRSASALQQAEGHHGVDEVFAEGLAPKFTRQDKMHSIVAKPAGNMMRLKCSAEGDPSPNITWFKNDATPDRPLETIRYGRWSIMMEDLVTTDSGNYTCLVCNIHGCINFTFTVHILERLHQLPIFTEAPKNTTVAVGTSTTLRCSVLSDLHPYVSWWRGIVKYPTAGTTGNTETEVLCSGRFECGNMETLKIHNVTAEESGWYSCVAGNSLGVVVASAFLNVVDESTYEAAVNKCSHLSYRESYLLVLLSMALVLANC